MLIIGGNEVRHLTDLHAHILPGVDHGCKNIEESLKLIEEARAIGVTTIVATPHFYHHSDPIDEFLERRQKGYETLRRAMDERGIDDLRILLAAEVSLEPDMVNELSPKQFQKLAIEGTDYILTEMPLFDAGWSTRIYDALCELEAIHKLTPIIAHIERYNASHAENLISQGYITQVNADLYASSYFGRSKFTKLVESGAAQLIGSDLHDPDDRNYANFKKLVSKLPKKMLEYLCKNAETILENRKLER